MTRITMPPRKAQVPAKQTHRHEFCGHWCACVSGAAGVCRKCHLDAFNHERRADAEWLADYDAAFPRTAVSSLDTQTPAVSGELLQTDRGSDPPKGKRVIGTQMTLARGAESVLAPHVPACRCDRCVYGLGAVERAEDH